MIKIPKEKSISMMSKNNTPVEKIHSGETLVFQTADCYNDQITKENQNVDPSKRQFSNPATGPVYIEDAEVGDILKIEILDIKINDYGVMVLQPNSGVLGEYVKENKTSIIPIEDDKAIFNDKIQIPLNPMIGVIGVAPKEGDIRTTVPDIHGGNMDCKEITKGSTVYLPVFVKGALLSIGDLHAMQGDGEIVICALEVGGEVTVRLSVIKNKILPIPMVLTETHVMTIASKKTLDEAGHLATVNMHQFLVNELEMDTYEAGRLLSLVGDLRICQVVDPLMTTRMELPLSILKAYQYKMV